MITLKAEAIMKDFYVYLADIYGDNIEIEKGILQRIAEVKQGGIAESETRSLHHQYLSGRSC